MDKAESAILNGAALLAEGFVRTGAPVDTGFLRSTVQAIFVGGRGGGGAAKRLRNREGQLVRREAGNLPPAPSRSSGVGVAASYAAHVEPKQPFIVPGVQRVRGAIGGVVSAVAAREGLG